MFFNIPKTIDSFFIYLSKMNCISDNIYNEFSLQFELGLFLRCHLPEHYSIQFERPVNTIITNYRDYDFVKKEIDLVILDTLTEKMFCIELKYPTNGQHPVQMYKFCEDVRFLEQLQLAGINECWFICLVDDYLFYKGRLTERIYGVFRESENNPAYGLINSTIDQYYLEKPLQIEGNYNFSWSRIGKHDNYRYMMIHID